LRSQPVRLCSAAVVLATVVQVVVLALTTLEGLWLALSFIGLGLVLLPIGYVYQRFLFTRRPPPEAAAPAT
jgi:uncharacterized membrane protein